MKKSKKKLLKWATLTALASSTIHAINYIIDINANVEHLLSKREGDFFKWNLGKIYYTKKGEGSPILLVHDLNPMSCGYEWKNVETELSKEHTVYTIDLLGCGRSSKPDMTYTNFVYVEIINEFIKTVIGVPTTIIASNFSSSLALMTAKYNSDYINKIIMINPPSLNTLEEIPTEQSKRKKSLLTLPLLGRLYYNYLFSKDKVREKLLYQLYYPMDLTDDVLQTYYETAHKNGSASRFLLASIEGLYTNSNLRHCVYDLEIPIYLLHGEGDPAYERNGLAYGELLPNIHFDKINKTKTLPHLEAPETFLSICKKYL